jgi:allantoinase
MSRQSTHAHDGRRMDNGYYDWSPIHQRERLTWPEEKNVALCVVVNLEYDEPGGPEHQSAFSQREYGNRVGIFRVMDVLRKHEIRVTAAVDAGVAELRPSLVEECQARGWEIIAHGLTANQPITSKMTEADEEAYIHEVMDLMAARTGMRPRGWLGSGFGESARTPSLLAAAGLSYVCDWPNDEQPYWMETPNGALVSLPVTLDVDSGFARERRVTNAQWLDRARATFDRLALEGADNGRVLVMSLYPWLDGQPHRIKYLDQALAHISSYGVSWSATGGEIVDWFSAASPLAVTRHE